jgi:hypothetical protein
MFSAVNFGSSTRSVLMMFLYPGPAFSISLGPFDVPVASSGGVCWAPASANVFQNIAPGSRQLAVGGQMLTCAICRSGIRGLDLFPATSSGFDLLELGGGKSGSVASVSGAGSAGVDPSGADGSGAGAAVTGPALVDSSRVDDPGAGIVVADFSRRSAALAALMKSSQSSYKSKK